MDEGRCLAVLTASDYSGVPGDVLMDLLLKYDWPNAAEHQQWLNTAPVPEIAAWLADLCRDDPAGIIAAYQAALEQQYGPGWREREDAALDASEAG
jgi:hypothetical protein